jgi:hypothetical protein
MSVIQTHNKGFGGIPNVYVDNDGNLQFKAALSDPQEFSLAPGGEVKVSGLNYEDVENFTTINPNGTLFVSGRPSGASTFTSINGALTLSETATGQSTQSFSAGKFSASIYSDYNLGSVYGVQGTAVKQGDGDISKLYGLYFLGRGYQGGNTNLMKGAHIETNLFNSATADTLYGIHSYVNLTGAFVKKIAALYAQLSLLNTTGVEEYYGLLIEQTDVAASVKKRAIYSLSNESSTFNGRMGVGESTNSNDPEADLHIRSSGSNKSLQIGENSSGLVIYNPDFFGVKYWYANPFGSFFPTNAHIFDCATMTTGGKLIVARNNGENKAWIDADGYLYCAGVINI